MWLRVRRWFGLTSPSRAAEKAGRQLGEALLEGIQRGEARAAAGLPPEPLSDEAIEWAARVSHRSFPSLYDDED